MKITDVETYVLLADNYDPNLTSSAQDTCLVIIKTDEGIEGYGECDTSPWVAKAFIESPGTHTMDQCVKDICGHGNDWKKGGRCQRDQCR